MSKQIIWFISKYNASPPNDGNGSTRVFLTMREMSRQGHHVTIFTSSADPYAELNTNSKRSELMIIDNIRIWVLRGLKYKKSISLLRILSWLHFEFCLFRDYKFEKSRPNVIIVSSPSLLTIINGFYLKRKFKAKLIFEVRDIWPLTMTEEVGLSRWNPLIYVLGFIEKAAYKYANGIVGTMPNLSQHVENKLGYNRKVGFAPIGFSDEYYNEQKTLDDSFIRDYIPFNKFLVVYAGTIGSANALETLFKCAQILEKNDGEIHFLLVGNGALLDEYRNKYKHLSNVQFAPKIKKNQIQALLTYANALYLGASDSKVWQYGQSLNKLVDYMLSAKPVIASYSGFPTMLNESGCGIFIPAGNAVLLAQEISRLKDLPIKERIEMGQKGKEWIMANRKYASIAQNYLKYISEVS